MKGNSNNKPNSLEQIGSEHQVRWNIVRNDRTNMDGTTIESWDYEYANCVGSSYQELIEGIIRTKYTQSQAEAILANYLDGKNTDEYMSFQNDRVLAKSVANGKSMKVELTPTIEEAKAKKLREIKRTAKELLSITDFYVIRKSEGGKAIPADVIAERQAVRAKSDELELVVGGLGSVEEVLNFKVIF